MSKVPVVVVWADYSEGAKLGKVFMAQRFDVSMKMP